MTSVRFLGWQAVAVWLVALRGGWPAAAAAGDVLRGQELYRQQCAACHGARGEGAEGGHATPLAGDSSPKELAAVIAETMPKDADTKCPPADALDIAEYMHHEFYSETARMRNAPPVKELSRLTVRQFRCSVADLLAGIKDAPAARWDDRRGLQLLVYQEHLEGDNSLSGKRDLVTDETSSRMVWDLGEEPPVPGKMNPKTWSASFEGSLFAPETGVYEIVFSTANSGKLWLNDGREPFIDASVRSGESNEHRKVIFLLGGRSYPFRVYWLKTFETKAASLRIGWRMPQGVDEPIPSRLLSPTYSPETLLCETPLPPDDASVGYERGANVSKEWDEAVTAAAFEVASRVSSSLGRYMPGGPDAATDAKQVKDFCAKLAEAAFRARLSDEERRRYVDAHFRDGEDPSFGAKRSILLCLKSPRFLYAGLGRPHGEAVAAHLALALWDSIPDETLRQAAAAGELERVEGIRAQAQRMIDDPRAHAKLREFFDQWLGVRHIPALSKDPAKFPDFNETIAFDLRRSLDFQLADVSMRPQSDFRQLLHSDRLWVNGRLAQFYGLPLAADADWQLATIPGERASGVLTHPYLLSGFAYYGSTSPIHRGLFVTRSLLGRTLRPPPVSIAPLAEDLHPSLTTREKVVVQTKAGMCQTCHRVINPLGFALEHFDAVGRWRDEEKGKPVDAQGHYLTVAGEEVKFDGMRSLADFLANSDEVHGAFVRQLFQYLVKQPIAAYGPEMAPAMRAKFVEHEFAIGPLMVELAVASAP